MQILRLQQMNETYMMLSHTMRSSERDTLWRRVGTWNQISSKDHESSAHPTSAAQAVDHFHSSKKACLTFQKFRKIEAGSADDTSNLALIRLDAIITAAVDNFPAAILNTSNSIGNGAALPCASNLGKKKGVFGSENYSIKSRTVPQRLKEKL